MAPLSGASPLRASCLFLRLCLTSSFSKWKVGESNLMRVFRDI